MGQTAMPGESESFTLDLWEPLDPLGCPMGQLRSLLPLPVSLPFFPLPLFFSHIAGLKLRCEILDETHTLFIASVES